MFHPLVANAFRLVGAGAGTSRTEIDRLVAAHRRASQLGGVKVTEWDTPFIGPLSRDEQSVQHAVGRLGDPIQRVRERVFWFSSPDVLGEGLTKDTLESSASRCEAESHSTSEHDAALLRLLSIVISDPNLVDIERWARVLRCWRTVVANDAYWGWLLELEIGGSFEPTASGHDIALVRNDTLRVVGDVIAGMARGHIDRGDDAAANRALVLLQQANLDGPLLAELESSVVGPLEDRVERLSSEIRQKCGDQVARDNDSADSNRIVCEKALSRLREELVPALIRLLTVAGVTTDSSNRGRDSTADCLDGIATDFTWADDFVTAEILLKEAKSIVSTLSPTERRIEAKLIRFAPLATKQTVLAELEPMHENPSLTTYFGVGFKLYGRDKPHVETRSYVATHYFVFAFIPIYALAQYRVVAETSSSYWFIGKVRQLSRERAPLAVTTALTQLVQERASAALAGSEALPPMTAAAKPMQRLGFQPLGLILAAVLLLLMFVLNDDRHPATSRADRAGRTPRRASTAHVRAEGPYAPNAPENHLDPLPPSASLTQPATVGEQVVGEPEPDVDLLMLDKLKDSLNGVRQRIHAKESSLDAVNVELGAMKKDIEERHAAQEERRKRIAPGVKLNRRSRSAVEAHNRIVDAFNADIPILTAKIGEFDAKVAVQNGLVGNLRELFAEESLMVDEYNGHLDAYLQRVQPGPTKEP